MNLDRKKLLRIGGLLFLLYLCIHYWDGLIGLLLSALSATGPLIFGFIIAYFVNILMSVYERFYFTKSKSKAVRLSRRPVCMLLAFSSLLFIIAFVIILILPELVACVQLLANEIPEVWNQFFSWLEENLGEERLDELMEMLGASSWDWQDITQKVGSWFVSGLGQAMTVITNVLTGMFSAITTFVVGAIFSIYLLIGKEKLLEQLHRVTHHYLKDKWGKKISYVASVLNHSFRSFIVGQCIEAVILGALCTLGMHIFRFPYANMIGALIGFTALIPVVGAYLGAGIGAFMIFTVAPIKTLFFLIFIVVLQQIEGNIIYPRVVGASIGLPGVWVLAAVTVGGGLLGVGGMLLGVPLASAAYKLLKDDLADESPLRVPD